MKFYQTLEDAELMRHMSTKMASRHSAVGMLDTPYDSTKFPHHDALYASCIGNTHSLSESDASEEQCSNVGYKKRIQIPSPPWASTSAENQLSKGDEKALMDELEALGPPSANDTTSCELGAEETPYVPDPHTAWCEKYARASGWIPAEPYDSFSRPSPLFSGSPAGSPSNTAPEWTSCVYPWYLANYHQSNSYSYYYNDASQPVMMAGAPLQE